MPDVAPKVIELQHLGERLVREQAEKEIAEYEKTGSSHAQYWARKYYERSVWFSELEELFRSSDSQVDLSEPLTYPNNPFDTDLDFWLWVVTLKANDNLTGDFIKETRSVWPNYKRYYRFGKCEEAEATYHRLRNRYKKERGNGYV